MVFPTLVRQCLEVEISLRSKCLNYSMPYHTRMCKDESNNEGPWLHWDWKWIFYKRNGKENFRCQDWIQSGDWKLSPMLCVIKYLLHIKNIFQLEQLIEFLCKLQYFMYIWVLATVGINRLTMWSPGASKHLAQWEHKHQGILWGFMNDWNTTEHTWELLQVIQWGCYLQKGYIHLNKN